MHLAEVNSLNLKMKPASSCSIRTIKVFCSHDWGTKDGDIYPNHEKVKKIKLAIESLTKCHPKYRIKGWLDEDKLTFGDAIEDILSQAVSKCPIFLYFITANYRSKYLAGLSGENEYCHLELQAALNLDKFKIPVMLDESMKSKDINKEDDPNGKFTEIISGIFYCDFSYPALFEDKNEAIFLSNCSKLVNAIIAKDRERRHSARALLSIRNAIHSASDAVSSIADSSNPEFGSRSRRSSFSSLMSSPSHFYSPIVSLQKKKNQDSNKSNNHRLIEMKGEEEEQVRGDKCISHERPLEVIHEGKLKCSLCVHYVKVQVPSVKDYISSHLLPEIDRLSPKNLIEKKFYFAENFLENLVNTEINLWKQMAKTQIQEFYCPVECHFSSYCFVIHL
jgi:hypothetical protein